jgi:ABC-type lipoprotein release transport system permease subunit
MKIPFSYTWRSLWARRLTTALTLTGLALVAFVFAAVLMLSRGVENTMIETGSPDNAIILRKSATSELVSQIDRDHANIIKTFPEVALLPDGKPYASTETFVVINLLKHGSNDMGNVSVRGVSPEAKQLRPQVTLKEGRWFTFGTQEIVVGTSVAERFQKASIGDRIAFGGTSWTIVGIIDGQGSAFDSEVWGDASQIMSVFNRPVYSIVLLRLRSVEEFDALKLRVEQDPRTSYTEVKREQVFYREQSQALAGFIKGLGLVVTVIFSIGAMIGAMITMYAAVANRTREIGTLRALGFRRRSVLSAFLIESILLSIVGGLVGVSLASFMSLVKISTTNFGTFSELAFGFALAPDIIVSTLIFAVVMGIVGGFLPAVRASRLNILTALRSA